MYGKMCRWKNLLECVYDYVGRKGIGWKVCVCVCVCVRRKDVSMWSNSVFFVYLSVCVCAGGMSALFASVWCGWFC